MSLGLADNFRLVDRFVDSEDKQLSKCDGRNALMKAGIVAPTLIEAAGNQPKRIEEYVGRVNSNTDAVSIARMISPSGWLEPPQTPEFDEFSVVLQGELHACTGDETMIAHAGEALIIPKGCRVQYSTPGPEGAEYISVCLPAFGPDLVHRE
jgi:mannose-6-phosphate isomerase-like protein (cupin superfamily)